MNPTEFALAGGSTQEAAEKQRKREDAERAGGDAAQDALNRMKRASDRGTGCHLTAEMIAALNVTTIGAIWEEEDPRQQD